MGERLIRVAIDGPAAAGKSTVAKIVANQLNLVYIDTGAMYRAIALKISRENISVDNEAEICAIVENTTIELKNTKDKQIVLLDGVDVTSDIRSQAVSNAVAKVASYRCVRDHLTKQQKELARSQSVVMDGRDIGTTIIPEAEVKVFLIASVEERAKRRHDENLLRGYASDLSTIIEEIKARDKQDYERDISPLTKADDAWELDTTSLSIDEVAQAIIDKMKAVI